MVACEVAVLEDAVDEDERVPAAARLAAHLLREVRGDTGRYGEVRARVSRRTEAATSPTELPTARSISCRRGTGEI